MPTQTTTGNKAQLDAQQRVKLTQLEDVISTAQRWQAEAAKALVVIRDQKLYRAEFPTFERYAQERWGYERAYLYHLCQWGETIATLSTFGDSLPERESHARPLYSLSPEDQREVWGRVLRQTANPTAREVEAIAREYRSTSSREHTGALLYYGSKAAIAPQIIAELPVHHCFVETHAGGAAVMLAKEPSAVEVLNDVDGSLVNFYRVLREPRKQADLMKRLRLTPYARAEWEQCRATVADPKLSDVERARRYFVFLSQSFIGTGTGFSRSNLKPFASTFANRVEALHGVAERLRRVMVEALDAVDLIRRYDDPQTCFYVDPPYLPGVGSSGKYRHEMTTEQHVELLDVLNGVRGKVLLSGFETDLYADALRSWRVCWRHRVACKDATDVTQRKAEPRTEVLWANW